MGRTGTAKVTVSFQTLDDLNVLAFKPSSTEQTILKDAIGLFITAIQEHKERESARAMDAVVNALYKLFVKEESAWTSINTVYIDVAATLATKLITDGAIDNTGMLKPALDPFGLTPLPAVPAINVNLAGAATQLLQSRQQAFLASSARATASMEQSLHEMSDRIHLVATEKPLSFRLPPLTLANVEQWASHILAY